MLRNSSSVDSEETAVLVLRPGSGPGRSRLRSVPPPLSEAASASGLVSSAQLAAAAEACRRAAHTT